MQKYTCKVKRNIFYLNVFLSVITLYSHKKNPNCIFCRANVPVEEPVMAPEALIDVAKYVGSLTFQVWEKMHKIAKYSESMQMY